MHKDNFNFYISFSITLLFFWVVQHCFT
jgi:hypothetical protein